MRIDEFKAKNNDEKDRLEKKLDSFKLEKVLSLWYFVRSAAKGTIIGAKN